MRPLLIVLNAFVGITSTLIGMLLIAYPVLTAYSYSLDFLNPAFSKNFLVPGTAFITTGIINLSALIANVQHNKAQYNLSLVGGLSMISWVVVHALLLQTMPWLYSTYLVCGCLIMIVAWQLKGKWAA